MGRKGGGKVGRDVGYRKSPRIAGGHYQKQQRRESRERNRDGNLPEKEVLMPIVSQYLPI